MGRPASLRTSRWRRRMPTRAACGSWTGPTKFTEIRSGGWSCANTRCVSQPPTDSADDVRLDSRIGEASARFTGGRLAVQEAAIEIAARMRAAVDDAVAAHPAARVVMIGHGIAILNYLAAVLRLAPGTLRLYPSFTG